MAVARESRRETMFMHTPMSSLEAPSAPLSPRLNRCIYGQDKQFRIQDSAGIFKVLRASRDVGLSYILDANQGRSNVPAVHRVDVLTYVLQQLARIPPLKQLLRFVPGFNGRSCPGKSLLPGMAPLCMCRCARIPRHSRGKQEVIAWHRTCNSE